MSTADKLLALKSKIESQKSQLARLEGQRDEPMKLLKEEFGISSLEKAIAKRDELKKEYEVLSMNLEASILKFQKAYPELQ